MGIKCNMDIIHIKTSVNLCSMNDELYILITNPSPYNYIIYCNKFNII